MEKNESPDLANFLNQPSRPELGRLLARIYGEAENFNFDPDDNLSNAQELKDCAKSLLIELQK